ncbi:phosphonate ABC transporter, permease protein PhnE [Candidatus Enterococcus murrayae]|uniref:Phosphonate ABC transporter, permease protein PhnE n=1 Tax=Candidatus Enterococcus murrayae TaxID=2815321 RepID=A0ABS3HJN9_9ENTE|nr:phosphonate ABC transporter, permease protein PhnE [Enterococcus sp. MJM16]MBO0453503.1 phosphonate ABC transporter, permease protein PhnE [Enterococcus sp. MJM16]
MEKGQKDIFTQRRKMMVCLLVFLLGLYTFSAVGTNFDLLASLPSIPAGFGWLFINFVPTEASLEYLPMILTKLWQTMLMSVTATTTAAIFALFMAIFGSRETGIHPLVKGFAHVLASFFRNMPIVVWAMILLLSFKQSEFTGYLAIFFATFGYLTRAFMETIDEIAGSTIEALTATGASYFQVIFQGVLPMVGSQLISWVLFLIENNIRDATLVGILTGTGIGFLFDLYYKKFQYDITGMIILTIVIVVIGLELFSNKIRRSII